MDILQTIPEILELILSYGIDNTSAYVYPFVNKYFHEARKLPPNKKVNPISTCLDCPELVRHLVALNVPFSFEITIKAIKSGKIDMYRNYLPQMSSIHRYICITTMLKKQINIGSISLDGVIDHAITNGDKKTTSYIANSINKPDLTHIMKSHYNMPINSLMCLEIAIKSGCKFESIGLERMIARLISFNSSMISILDTKLDYNEFVKQCLRQDIRFNPEYIIRYQLEKDIKLTEDYLNLWMRYGFGSRGDDNREFTEMIMNYFGITLNKD